jgi:diguanylate cyclase (GGDEF)-like protein/PAS domain S-box-containing protein
MTHGPQTSTEELLQFLYLMPVGAIKFRGDGSVDLINPMASALLQSLAALDPLTNVYQSLACLVPDLHGQVKRFVGNAGNIIDQQRLVARAGGKAMVLSLTVNRVSDQVYMAVLKDVTKMAAQEHRLFVDRQKFFAIFDHVRDYAIYTITIDGIVEEWNQSVQRYAGWLAADLQGRSMSLFFPADDPARPDLCKLLAEAKRVGSVETEGWRQRRDGSRLWANTIITALPDEVGDVRGFVVVSRDITGRKRSEDDMKLLATVDPLTGAYNRRQGDALLAAEFGRYARDGRPFAVLMLDIDHFKEINDRLGHAAGDSVLCALVGTCQSALRTIDIVVRWGGEEFLLLLPGTDATAAVVAAERVRTKLAEMQVAAPGGSAIHLTVSIGIAVAAGEGSDDLLRRSDMALYAAKRGGRNRTELAP